MSPSRPTGGRWSRRLRTARCGCEGRRDDALPPEQRGGERQFRFTRARLRVAIQRTASAGHPERHLPARRLGHLAVTLVDRELRFFAVLRMTE